MKAKKNAVELAKQRLAEQQKQAMKQQAEKRGNTLGDFFSKDEDDGSTNSDDDDMFSFLQWSATGSENIRSQSVGRAGRSRSAPRIRLSSSSVASLLSDSKSKAKEPSKSTSERQSYKRLGRSLSVPKTREDLEASIGTLHTQTLTSLYGTDVKNKVTRSLSITKDESKECVSMEWQRSRKPGLKDDRLSGSSKRSKHDKERSGSRLRSVRQLRQDEAYRHQNDRKDSDKKNRKSSRKSKRRNSKDTGDDDKSRSSHRLRKSKHRSSKTDNDGDKSKSGHRHSRRGRKSEKKSQDEESTHRSKSRQRLKDVDDSHHRKRGKSRRRVEEGGNTKKRTSKSSLNGSPRSKSDDGQDSRHSRRCSTSRERRKSSYRGAKIHHRSVSKSLEKSRSGRHSEEALGDHPLRRSVSLPRRSDSEAQLLRAASQLLFVDEEIDHRAISDGEDSNRDLQGRKSYFSQPISKGGTSEFQYSPSFQDERSAQQKATKAPPPPRRTIQAQQEEQPSTFQSLRSMLPNLNLADEA